jgi:uncharacterized membrane protein
VDVSLGVIVAVPVGLDEIVEEPLSDTVPELLRVTEAEILDDVDIVTDVDEERL